MKKTSKIIISLIILLAICIFLNTYPANKKNKTVDHLVELTATYQNTELDNEAVREAYMNLSKYDIMTNTDEIILLVEKILDNGNPNLSIEILEFCIKSNRNLPYEIQKRLENNLKTLYIINNEYSKVIEISTNLIALAEQHNDGEAMCKSLIELGIIFKRLDLFELAEASIVEGLKIEIEDKYYAADMKSYGIINLSDVYFELGKYGLVEEMIPHLESYREYFEEEDFQDIEILKLNIEAQVNIHYNRLDFAKQNLDDSFALQQSDKELFYYGKDLLYKLALGKYYTALNDIEAAKAIYRDILSSTNDTSEKFFHIRSLEELIIIETNPNLQVQYYEEFLQLNSETHTTQSEGYATTIIENMSAQLMLEKNTKFIINIYRSLALITLLIFIFRDKIKSYIKSHSKDVLVNAYNRKIFNSHYAQLLKKTKQFYILMIDIDNFKKLNDTYGHQLGDHVLMSVCDTINQSIDKNSKLYRYGGEEFVIISKIDKEEDLLILAEKIRKNIELMYLKDNLNVTISMGISNFKSAKKEVLADADANLYFAKKTGKNKISYRNC